MYAVWKALGHVRNIYNSRNSYFVAPRIAYCCNKKATWHVGFGAAFAGFERRAKRKRKRHARSQS